MESKTYLEFTVIAAIVTTIGTLLGLFIKEFLLVRYFDNSKEIKTLKNVSKKYQDPIVVAGTELARRMSEMIPHPDWTSKGFKRDILFSKATGMQTNDISDPYFLKYKVISTLYRFAAFFGWLELYRQDITFLNSYSKVERLRSGIIIEKIKSAVADGHINNNPDWERWKDVLIFREELRALGDGMIEITNGQRTIIGYGKFQSFLEAFEKTENPIWLRPLIAFFTDLEIQKDYRFERFFLLKSSILELIKFLDNDYYKVYLKNL